MSPPNPQDPVNTEPLDTATVSSPGDSQQSTAFQFFNGPDYLSLPRAPQPWIIKDLIPVSGLVNLYGKAKSGKSFLALQLGAAITNHAISKWEGFDIMAHGPVAYLQIDTPRSVWAERLGDLTAAGYDFSAMFFADMNTVAYPTNVLNPAHIAGLARALRQLRPLVTIIDTLRESFKGDENNSDVMRDVITNLVAASRPSAIILLSHQRKDGVSSGGEDSMLMDDNRGSSYVPGRMDVIMRLTRQTLTFQGRSVGQQQLPVVHDPTLHTVHIAEHQKEQDRVMRDALRTMGATSERAMVRILIGEESAERVNDSLFGALRGQPESTVRRWLRAEIQKQK